MPKMKISKRQLSEWRWAYLLVAPTIIGLIILNIIPIAQTLYMSFCKSGAFGKGNEFVGLENYKALIQDTQVWHAVRNTLGYMIFVVPITIIIALIVAVLLNKKRKGRGIYRTIFFIPMVAAPAATSMVWKWLYNYQFGLINYVLNLVGIGKINWIDNPKVAPIAIVIMGVWGGVGYSMVLLLAGLQEIPRDYYEAAGLDGASKLQQFFRITLPLLSPTLFFVVVTSIISAMQVFDLIYMMVDVASPAYESVVSLVYLFYNNSFKYSNKGYGSAIAMLLLAIIMVITVIQTEMQDKWVKNM